LVNLFSSFDGTEKPLNNSSSGLILGKTRRHSCR
jgi:hypothetical protein